MSDDAKAIFVRKFNLLMSANGMSQLDVAEKLGISKQAVSDWSRGKKMPRMDKLDELADLFGVHFSELLTDAKPDTYYTDPDTQRIAEQIASDSELKLLFDAASTATADDLKTVHTMLQALKDKEDSRDD